MKARPCAVRRLFRRQGRTLAALLALFALAAFLCPAAALAQDEDRGLAPGPRRHVLVKAVGQGTNAGEAEQNALRAARLIAAKHYAALGGATALDTAPQGTRVIGIHHSPPMGFAAIRSVALVELRLRSLHEPPPTALALPVLKVNAEPGQVQVEASHACEVMLALDHGSGAEPEILPGGGGAAYRLAPGKPMRQPLPAATAPATLRVLACTGGLYAPANAPSMDEALAKARAGKPRPTIMQGVVSECVEIQAPLPAPPDTVKRSIRQKGSETPVNMTGAAGREAGLPVPAGKETP